MADRSPLRQALDTAIAEANGHKLSMKDLTVLAVQNDPFRIDTPAAHRDGEWQAILDTTADFTAQTRALVDSKAYLPRWREFSPSGKAYRNGGGPE